MSCPFVNALTVSTNVDVDSGPSREKESSSPTTLSIFVYIPAVSKMTRIGLFICSREFCPNNCGAISALI